MKGKRVAVFGLGRSGLAIGRAALALGADARIFDESPREALLKPEMVDEAESAGLEVVASWDGALPPDTDLLVSNPAVPKWHPILANAQRAGIEVIGEVEFAYRIARAPIVALTGTNGKSTTTVMTCLCLEAAGAKPILCGNIFGSGFAEMPLTQAALEADPSAILVAEISSFQLEWVSEFRPCAAGITNISADHLDRYADQAEYAATKKRIFAGQGAGDIAVLPAGMAVELGAGVKEWRFGEPGSSAWVESDRIVVHGFDIRRADLPFNEDHNLVNAAMAVLLASGALVHRGWDLARAVAAASVGLKEFAGLAHRNERVGERDGILVVNNSMCTNPEAVIRSVASLHRPAHVLLGVANKALSFGPLKEFFAAGTSHPYLFGMGSAEFAESIGVAWPAFEDLGSAFDAAAQQAKAGEAVILAPGCATWAPFRDFKERGNFFKSVAMEWLER